MGYTQVSKTEMITMEKKLDRLATVVDSMEIEILKLRAKLVPTERISEKERRELRAAQKRIAKGHWISLDDLTKEFG
jgi:uncharacterized coiled-coil DUF342 family protein